MSNVRVAARQGTNAVKKLREQKLKTGLPFMINAKELPTNQCYLEYPDGSIKLMILTNPSRNLDVVRVLTSAEANSLRSRYHFS